MGSDKDSSIPEGAEDGLTRRRALKRMAAAVGIAGLGLLAGASLMGCGGSSGGYNSYSRSGEYYGSYQSWATYRDGGTYYGSTH